MNTKTILVALALASCLFAGCEAPCPLFGNDVDINPDSIVKFMEGQDMSNNVYVYFYQGQGPVRDYLWYRPIALHGGYYLMHTFGTVIDTVEMAFLSCTYDDLEGGLLPEDWQAHWQDYYDTVRNPFMEVYGFHGSSCDKNMGIPFYCNSCSSTFYIDTAMLNRMLDEDASFLTNSEYIIPRYIRNQ